MKLNVTDYDSWLALSPEQKQQVSQSWNVYRREGIGFVLCAAGRLVLSTPCKVINAKPGVFHGGVWVIHGYVEKKDFPLMPASLEQEFEGFRVIWIEAILGIDYLDVG